MFKTIFFVLILYLTSFAQLFPSSVKWWHIAQDAKDSLWSVYYADTMATITADTAAVLREEIGDSLYIYTESKILRTKNYSTIEAALNAMKDSTRLIVKGNYEIIANYTLKGLTNITIEGLDGATIRYATGVHSFSFDSCGVVTVKNINFTCDDGDSLTYGVSFSRSKKVYVEKCSFSNFSNHLLMMYGVDSMWVSNSSWVDPTYEVTSGDHGFDVDYTFPKGDTLTNSYLSVTNCIGENAQRDAMKFENIAHVEVIGGYYKGNIVMDDDVVYIPRQLLQSVSLNAVHLMYSGIEGYGVKVNNLSEGTLSISHCNFDSVGIDVTISDTTYGTSQKIPDLHISNSDFYNTLNSFGAIRLSGTGNTEINDNIINSPVHYGILYLSTIGGTYTDGLLGNTKIHDNIIVNTGNNSVDFDGDNYDLKEISISNNTITGGDGYGVRFTEATSATINGNTITNKEYGGISVTYADSAIVKDNKLANNYTSAGYSDQNVGDLYLAHSANITAKNNKLTSNYATPKTSGILLYNVDSSVVSFNEIYNYKRGIYLRKDCQSLMLGGNECTGNSDVGLFIDGTLTTLNADVIVQGGKYSNNGSNGIELQIPHTKISDVTCSNNNGIGLLLSADADSCLITGVFCRDNLGNQTYGINLQSDYNVVRNCDARGMATSGLYHPVGKVDNRISNVEGYGIVVIKRYIDGTNLRTIFYDYDAATRDTITVEID